MPDADFYRLSAEEALKRLGSSMGGLSGAAARRHLKKYGPNELAAGRSRSRLMMFLSQFRDLLVLVLIVAGAVSYAIALIESSWANFRDGSVMFFIVLVNAVIGFFLEYKARAIVAKLRVLISSPARVMRNGSLGEVPPQKLVPGDVVRIEEGDKVPADLRILETANLRCNEFSLTGESVPQSKKVEAIDGDAGLADRDNMAWAGTLVASGSGMGLVVRTGMNTEVGRIAAMTEDTVELKSPLQQELDVLAKRLTIIVVAISAVLFFVALWQGLSWLLAATYALGVAVASVPQALPAQLTVAMSTSSQNLARRKAVVKSLPSVETLGSTNVICTDKTGTLTKNEMTVTRLWFNGEGYELTGVGYRPEGELRLEGGGAADRESREHAGELHILMQAATMASTAQVHPPDDEHVDWYAVGDPTEAALVVMSRKVGVHTPDENEVVPELQSFPFTGERRRMSSIRKFHDRNVLTMKGATQAVLDVSDRIYMEGEVRPMTAEDRERIMENVKRFSAQALRVLAFAHRPMGDGRDDYEVEEAERGMIFLGLAGMIDPPRRGVKEAMAKCHEAHIDIYMITGDHAVTAQAIARQIGLARNQNDCPVLTGADLQELDDEALKQLMKGHDAMIFSRVEPAHKLRVVKLLSELDKVVAVTGDGVNDAPALKRAHIGVAMGRTGTDVAKEAAEVVLLDDSFPTLINAVEEGRTIYNNIRKVVLASLTTNTAELVAVLLGLVGIAMGNYAIPILAIQILAIDLLAEILPLTFLCYDPPTPEDMKRPPRSRDEHILDLRSGSEMVFLGILIGVLSVANYFLYMSRNGITLDQQAVGSLEYARASTLTWLTMGWCQFFNILSRRYEYTSIFNRNILTNRILFGSVFIAIGMVTLGVYAPYLSTFLQFAAVGWVDWLHVWGAALIFLAVWELIKFGRRMRRGRV